MEERNILAGFFTEEDAEKAAKQLKQKGFETVQVDHIGLFPGDGTDKIMNPISGEIPSLGSLTLAGDFSSKDASILAAANPSASGMADGSHDGVGRTVLLTAVVPEERGDEAVAIIRACGGEV
ncbi:hypothetical protein EDM56_22365 [Brevibacillus fluminis]|uniref:General stress protein 17M-like domain-containing protein n=1 Tax=Brevibacillus fluminis TaxID=511487 RepID=A0A3M8D710_9BACL|nr:hypothetical protein [Brevibacillus fluminis]RNB83411.1 hypothetical protein EDM56_22365 [Brevibacillus fluminis]